MRDKLAAFLAALLTVGTLAVLAATGSAPAAAATAEPYSWRNVEIAGGGFVPGIVFNRTERDLIYARTDIGGAYRWNRSTGRWVPLLDWVGWDDWGYNGVVSLASDPVEPNRVYVAAGMYTNSWDPNNGAVLRSADRGATWQVSPLPFKLGGNMPGRGMGERLAVDPNRNSVLYLGAPSGNGLWRSTDFGATWARVTSFPNPGNYVQDPNDPNGYLTDNQGVVWVTFDETTGTRGTATRTIYVGVADKENTVYRSVDAGATWSRLAGQPTGFIAHKGVLADGSLYLATSDTGGPYDGGKGDVWRYATATGIWTRISPLPSTDPSLYYGYSGLTVDRQRPGTLMVATQVSWWPDVIFFRSTDSGATWTRIWDFDGYPNRSKRYRMDVSAAPWLTFGQNPQPPEETPKLGWMTESMEIDPFDSNRMMYGTGATVYGTTDLLRWDDGGQITIRPMAAGLEETAVLDLVSPPTGAPLISALGDIGGFRHSTLDAVPAMMFTRPGFTSTTSLDFAELNPAVVVRAGNFADAERPADSHVGVLHRRRRELVPGHRAGRRERGRHGRRRGGRQPLRVGAARRPAGVLRRVRHVVVAGCRPADGRGGRVGPGEPGAVLRLQRRAVLRQRQRRRHVRGDAGDRASRDRPSASSSRRSPGGRATSGSPARAGCSARPTAVRRSPGWPRCPRDQRRLREGGARAVVPGRLPRRNGRRGDRRVPVGQRRRRLGADQRRRAPVRQHGRGADR